jgi:hypothetical protein
VMLRHALSRAEREEGSRALQQHSRHKSDPLSIDSTGEPDEGVWREEMLNR